MLTPQQRWERFRRFGIASGLSPEQAEDFAGDAYVRYLEATNKKIKFAYVLADMLRKWHGRVGTDRYKARSVSLDGEPFADGKMRRHEMIGVDSVLTEREILEACVEYAVKRNTHTYQWMSRLGKYLGLSFAEVEALYRYYNLHPQTEWQARRNRHCRASMERAEQKKLKAQ